MRDVTKETSFFNNNYIDRIINYNSLAREKMNGFLEKERPDLRERANRLV